MTPAKLILPPSQIVDEEELRTPYANEMLLLSFEGHHKKFEVDYEPEGKSPSYRPPPSTIQTKDVGLLAKLKRLRDKIRCNRQ